MKATILIPIVVLLAGGAATAVGVSMTSSAHDAPAGPIVVHAPQRLPSDVPAAPAAPNVPAAPGAVGSDRPAAPGSVRPNPPAAPVIPARPLIPPPVSDPAGVPAPPPAITDDGWGDDDDDGGWED